MAFSQGQPTVSVVAGSTFAKSSLYKFVNLNASGQVVVGGSTVARAIGTLRSVTNSTNSEGVEYVTVGLLSGIGEVRMAGSTEHVGLTIGASTAGLGVSRVLEASTAGFHHPHSTDGESILGTIVSGSSGSTGRIVSVLFHPGII